MPIAHLNSNGGDAEAGDHPIWSARLIVLAGAALLFAIGIALLWSAPVVHPATRHTGEPLVLRQPPPPLPLIEPLVIAEMTRDRARAINAAIPLATTPNPPARPFRFLGDAGERERAVTCLATAIWYEAGDDAIGEQAVAQVVLNRVRHPAYPHSVCGVVFQGAARASGCQFTFACDGSLIRVPSPAAWRRARAIAARALTGFVFAPVGAATHYHTNWVVPYWSETLDKVTEINTHIFLRWRGWWGTPGAFTARHAGPEVMDARIAAMAEPIGRLEMPPIASGPAVIADQGSIGAAPAVKIEGVSDAALRGSIVRLADAESGDFALQLDPAAFPGGYALTALSLCGKRSVCTVMGWLKPERMPQSLPAPLPSRQSLSFLYRRNTQANREQIFWNCQQIPRENPAQCLPGTETTPATPHIAIDASGL